MVCIEPYKINPPQKTPLNAETSSITSTRSGFKELARINKDMISSQYNYDNDKYLSSLLKVLKVKSVVVGVGGAGNNAVSRLHDMNVTGTETININTDAHDLYYSSSKDKLLIGKEKCAGLGSGNDPITGAEAAEEELQNFRKITNGDIVFLACGLGGGTGTGATPILAREAKKNNACVVTFCTLPFNSEGLERRLRAKAGLKELAKYSDAIIPLPNENLLSIVPNAPLLTCFKIMDEVMVRSIREIVGLINNCGLVNIDFADVKKVFEKTDAYPSGMVGITESLGQEKDLIFKSKLAVNNPLLRPDAKEVDKCLISVSSDHSLTLSKVDKIISTITNEIPRHAQLKFGTSMDPRLNHKIRIMFMGKGPVSSYVKFAVDSNVNLYDGTF